MKNFYSGGLLRGANDSRGLRRMVPQNLQKQVFSTRQSLRLRSSLLKTRLVDPINLHSRIKTW